MSPDQLRIMSILVLALSVLPSKGSAQGETHPNWTVQVDPLTTAFGIVHVLLERRITDNLALYAGPSLRLFDSPIVKDEEEEEGHRAYGVELGARWFFQGKAPIEWWGVAQDSYHG